MCPSNAFDVPFSEDVLPSSESFILYQLPKDLAYRTGTGHILAVVYDILHFIASTGHLHLGS